MRRVLTTAIALAAIPMIAATAGCSLGSGDSAAPSDHKVVLVTHDSFAYTKTLFAQFKKDTGITIEVHPAGDAGALTNQLVLTKANPIGDLAYGIDNTFATRALNAGVFAPYTSPQASKGPQRYDVDASHRLTAIDLGDVCLNVDPQRFKGQGLAVPKTFEDLTDPKYASQLVVEDPQTSSPGLAFLLATIAHFGENGWQPYWSKLKAGGVKVVSGWEEAYSQDFSGSSGKGPKGIVVSYASSPSAEIGKDGKPRTTAMLDTCFRQVEYAGVLQGAKNPEDAKKVLDFLLSPQFQADVPGQMYVYPSLEGVALPKEWQQAAPLPANPITMPGDRIQQGRDGWIRQWRSLVQG
jgi:thiamine transport system substrate-binding protein